MLVLGKPLIAITNTNAKLREFVVTAKVLRSRTLVPAINQPPIQKLIEKLFEYNLNCAVSLHGRLRPL